jgi:putative hydroxymethylpyrimidine transport system permease protein
VNLLRPLLTLAGLLALWWVVILISGVPEFILPGPWQVAVALVRQRAALAGAMVTTLTEVLLGLVLGVVLGGACGLATVFSPALQRWLMPLLVVSQAIPVFALAPLLVLWFGFGMASKIVMAILVIFFPVTAALADGLRRTDRGMVDLAMMMGASPLAVLWHVRLPAALPAFGAGLRVATAAAPIGAIIGEWVGSSSGLGYVMMNANARMQTATMFAALLVLAAVTMALWVIVDRVLRRLLFWAPDTTIQG